MENTNTLTKRISHRTKVLQFIAIGLFAFLTLPYLGYYLEKIIGNEFFIRYLLYSIIYAILAICASNKPTRVSTAIFSVAELIIWNTLLLIDVENEVYKMLQIIMITYILIFSRYYMYGVIKRNNNLNKYAALSLNTMVALDLFLLLINPIIPLIHNVYQYIIIITNHIYFIAFFFFARSEAFSGEYCKTQPIKGAYKFWNKYFTYFFITIGISMIIIIIAGL